MKAPNVDSLATTPYTVKCLDLRMDHLSLKRIVDLLRCFPCVEKLYIEVLLLHRYSSFRLAAISSTYLVLKCCFFLMYICSFQSTAPGINNNFWESEHRTLKCFAHLKTILVYSYMGMDCDVDFLNFFVLNARVLQSMTVVVKPDNDQELLAEQREKLQLDNRASRGAQFRFSTDDIRRKYWHIWNVRDLYLVDP